MLCLVYVVTTLVKHKQELVALMTKARDLAVVVQPNIVRLRTLKILVALSAIDCYLRKSSILSEGC